MKKEKLSLVVLTMVLFTCSALVSAQVRRGDVIVPESSISRPGDAGVRAHTGYVIYAPPGVQPNSPTPTGETPASLGCVYDLVSNPVAGCPINGTTENPSGGSGVIVIVDAFHYPTAQADDADPASGVSVYITSPACGNLQFGAAFFFARANFLVL